MNARVFPIAILAGLIASVPLAAQEPQRQNLGQGTFPGWTGGRPAHGLAVESGKTASFRFPQGTRGCYKWGMRTYHDGTRDWRAYRGLAIETESEAGREVELTCVVVAPPGMNADERTTAVIRIAAPGPVFLPWSAFDHNRARTASFKYAQGLDLTLRYTDGRPGSVKVRSVAVAKGESVSLEAAVRGRAAQPGAVVEYDLTVGNPSRVRQSVVLSFERYGWETMNPVVEPSVLRLEPGETKACKVKATLPGHLPPGAHEQQVLRAIANGNGASAATLVFTTAAEVPPPYILHTAARWQEVRDKVAKYAWAKEAQAAWLKRADEWQVPEIARPPDNDPDDTYGPFLFPTLTEQGFVSCAVSWQLTHNKAYAEKVAVFLRRLSDPKDGYPKTLRACSQGLVQEGHYFQHIAMSYDMIRDAGVLTPEDHARLEATFRLFLETIERVNEGGSINNWNVSELIGAFYCSLVLQDLERAGRFFSGPSGICDQLRIGTMDDGWWYECSISYNTWVAREFTQVALAYEPWGFNFREARLPASYSPFALIVSELNGGSPFETHDPEQVRKPFGMDPSLYGPVRKPWREIRQLWDSLIPFLDWRGVMFGVNDSMENNVVVPKNGVEPIPFEVAYYAYRDPNYASIIKRGQERDLLYGVPELPEKTPEPFRDNGASDNVGLVMLRSQTPGRPIREQIQAVLHYGTHGWAHGHYDRTGLLSLMRYGRSFYNPEMVWHGYEPYTYKFYVQTSVSKNMVVVDHKMQKAAPGERLLFHTGKMMQAAAVQVETPWGYPPYGGMVYDYVPVKSFAEKMWRDARFTPMPENPPLYGNITGYTEPVRQRRVMVVTDDYVLLADDLEGAAPHVFESLFQMKGFLGLEGQDKKFLRHDPQWDPDPLGSAQFVTDCEWNAVSAPARARFRMLFGPGADNEGTRAPCSEDGPLNLDVHSLWPPKQEIMIGTAPEDHGIHKRLFYTVRGDGKVLAEGKLGAWTLGQGVIDVPLEGVKDLELETRTELANKPSLFWGSARLVTKDGREIPLAETKPEFHNVARPKQANLDYAGGPVKIQGTPQAFSTPAEPADKKNPGLVRLDLTGKNAVRFKAVVGSDFPPGPEDQRRKTMAVRAPNGRGARFLAVIEPYEKEPVIRSAEATSDHAVRVVLTDGRLQEIGIGGTTGAPVVTMVESKDGQELRRECTQEGQQGNR